MPYGRYGFAPPPTAASGRTATGPPGGRATGPLTEPVGVGAAWVAAPDAVGPATTGPESIFAAAANGAAAIAAPDANAARADDNANLGDGHVRISGLLMPRNVVEASMRR